MPTIIAIGLVALVAFLFVRLRRPSRGRTHGVAESSSNDWTVPAAIYPSDGTASASGDVAESGGAVFHGFEGGASGGGGASGSWEGGGDSTSSDSGGSDGGGGDGGGGGGGDGGGGGGDGGGGGGD